jgi:hypothetical protein
MKPRADAIIPLRTLAGACAVACVSGGVAYRLIGVRIDSDGNLREPFALIPIAYLTGAASLVAGTAALLTRRMN